MNARESYEKTAIDAAGTLRQDSSNGYAIFAVEVDKLKAMESQGLFRIEFIHFEQQTGGKLPDLVRFIQLE